MEDINLVYNRGRFVAMRTGMESLKVSRPNLREADKNTRAAIRVFRVDVEKKKPVSIKAFLRSWRRGSLIELYAVPAMSPEHEEHQICFSHRYQNAMMHVLRARTPWFTFSPVSRCRLMFFCLFFIVLLSSALSPKVSTNKECISMPLLRSLLLDSADSSNPLHEELLLERTW